MLKAKNRRPKKGFTIIEVVLVLAIAGLIFMMVFIAFPALRRSQKDSQRKQNLNSILIALESWHTTHRGSITDDYEKRYNKQKGFCAFFNEYVGEEIVDPSTGEAPLIGFFDTDFVVNCRTDEREMRDGRDSSTENQWPSLKPGDIQYDDSGYCDGSNLNDHIGRDAGMKAYALRMKLEGGGYYCLDNGAKSMKYGRDSLAKK
jgi:prepilin-type N-terminal cleavage/methylation domain-containing protein